ncbi:methylmalonyl-CoA decarboxylase [Cyanobium sp. BA20m-p-22]|uniref:methylmalonyl-CoA decarboxylase n=1 Tax=Cyanobium sp. BA20m-p-22 TaxID=2823704 RepID=UPI0020CB9110|nr:methylmalonyl-CoA decarboxylase [Cyanobium sp. BA20m-p-22]
MFILCQSANQIGTVTLNQPAKHNALSRALVEELIQSLCEFQNDGVRVVVIRAASDASVWSAGHDINELPLGEDPLQYSDPVEQLLRAIASFPGPVIAMVHGSVWGAAVDLALSCDLILGDESCSFAITPANLGLAYNTAGLLHFMRRLPLNLLKEMLFTASAIKAEDAARWGILNHLVPESELEHFTYELVQLMLTKSPLVQSAVKQQLRLLSQAAPLTADMFEMIQGLREKVYTSDDYKEGIRAFQEKRKPVFKGV